jgi:hypothetical protein
MFEIQIVSGAQWERWHIPNYGEAVFETEEMARTVAQAACESGALSGCRVVPSDEN